MQKTKVVILAAGKGTRMKSELPKALMPLFGKPLVRHLLESVDRAAIDKKPIVVVGYGKDQVMAELGDKYEYAIQEEQLGTGHAVLAAREACKDGQNVIIISGDQPFLKPITIQNLFKKHQESGATITLCTTVLPDFKDWREAFLMYGRIIRKNGNIMDREYKDASGEEREIKEVNVSCFAVKAPWLWKNLEKLDKNSNVQNEYYLTDLWGMASDAGEKIESVRIDPMEALGANSQAELEILEKMGRI